ncbi:metal-dependent hydrolase [Tissierella creatinini]|nr:metal-dependent hydrolase [Tissierella creatinini]TJX61010.1 metal-dependent hydrolase [Soehngenia saccharolytica]
MTGKTHIAIGVTVGLILSDGQPIENKIILVLSAALGSLVPDLDHPKAKLNQKLLIFKNKLYSSLFYFALTAGFACLFLFSGNFVFKLLGILSFLIGTSNHRGFTHSIIGFLLFSWMVKLVTSEYQLNSIYLGFTTGYMLHLIADFFTLKGIKLFFPVNENISSPIILKPNTILEELIFICLSIYSLFLLIWG